MQFFHLDNLSVDYVGDREGPTKCLVAQQKQSLRFDHINHRRSLAPSIANFLHNSVLYLPFQYPWTRRGHARLAYTPGRFLIRIINLDAHLQRTRLTVHSKKVIAQSDVSL